MSNENNYDEDDDVRLPEDTLKILNEFLAEKTQKERLEQECLQENKCEVEFEENWQLSQFWYSSRTKEDLTSFCKDIIGNESSTIALLSCPSLYYSVKGIHERVKIFEFDKRFESYGVDFVHYDFNEAIDPDYLSNYNNSFDIIIADPPFLSQECIEKISKLIKRFMKVNAKLMFCSGTIVEPWVKEYLQLQKTSYKPEHERNLGNDFALYTNFDIR